MRAFLAALFVGLFAATAHAQPPPLYGPGVQWLPAPWTQQIHESLGGMFNVYPANSNSACPHVVLWADQNVNHCADSLFFQSRDASLHYTITVTNNAGVPIAGNVVGVDAVVSGLTYPVRYTVQSGDSNALVALGVAYCMDDTAGHNANCTGGTALKAALLAFNVPAPTDGIGYQMYQTGAAAQTSSNVTTFDFPFGASNSLAICTGASTPACNVAQTTLTASSSGLDGNPTLMMQRSVRGYTMQAGDILHQMEFKVDFQGSGGQTGQVGNVLMLGTASNATKMTFGTLTGGSMFNSSMTLQGTGATFNVPGSGDDTVIIDTSGSSANAILSFRRQGTEKYIVDLVSAAWQVRDVPNSSTFLNYNGSGQIIVGNANQITATNNGKTTVAKGMAWTPVAMSISAGAVAVDLNAGRNFTLALNSSATLSAPTNSVSGAEFNVKVTQTGGSNTLAYNSAYKWPAGVAPVITVTNNAIDEIRCRTYDNSTFDCIFSQNFQ